MSAAAESASSGAISQEDQIELTWGELMSRPAHEYLNRLLQNDGLPADVTHIVNRKCSFWIKNLAYQDDPTGTPLVATIDSVSRSGNCVALHLSSGREGLPSIIYLNGNGTGTLVHPMTGIWKWWWDRFASTRECWPVQKFQLL